MTVYSGTFRPTQGDGNAIPFRDPLGEAREKLRQAARLPFHAATPNSWRDSFAQLTEDARADIRRHVWLAGLPDSPLARVESLEPRLTFQVELQRSEHDIFADTIDELVWAAADAKPVDIWKMIELGERAILLEMALARHHNRLSQLIYETTHTDMGVAG